MVIWGQRNVVVHGGQLQELSALNHCARDVLEEYRQTQMQMLIPNPAVFVEVWCPPLSSRFKLNFDAALFANLDEIGMRAIVWNDKGEVMLVILARGPSVVDSEEEEIMA